MVIKLENLKKACDILLSKAINAGHEEIVINADNYWVILSGERENFNSSNPEIAVGSLVDDWKSLNKVIEGENIPTCVDFDRLANILITVGERLLQSDKIY